MPQIIVKIANPQAYGYISILNEDSFHPMEMTLSKILFSQSLNFQTYIYLFIQQRLFFLQHFLLTHESQRYIIIMIIDISIINLLIKTSPPPICACLDSCSMLSSYRFNTNLGVIFAASWPRAQPPHISTVSCSPEMSVQTTPAYLRRKCTGINEL